MVQMREWVKPKMNPIVIYLSVFGDKQKTYAHAANLVEKIHYFAILSINSDEMVGDTSLSVEDEIMLISWNWN